jgi:cysteine desulfurase family protein (TIGR01976 family)
MSLDLLAIRTRFPALQRQSRGRPIAFFDGPAGSQVPQSVVDAVSHSLLRANANCGAVFTTSQENDRLLAESRQAVADLLGSSDPDTVAFGANMTSLTLAASRAIASIWKPGDEIIVSQLCHDANVTPWVLAAQDAGATVHSIPFRAEDCTLDLDRYRELLSSRTRLVALGMASNATGTINPLAEMIRAAKAVGAFTFVDAVHYAPHGLIDVEALGCDFLVCSAYKFFGPHVGVMWGRRELLEAIRPYKLRPSHETLPGRWMTGTQNHEGIVGVRAAIDHIASIGTADGQPPPIGNRRAALVNAFEAITSHEQTLSKRFIAGLRSEPTLRVWGITDESRLAERVPTFSVTHSSLSPREMATSLWARGIQAWHGNHYAFPFTEAAGLEPNGTLRLGALHYNTVEEVDRAIESLRDILRTRST